MASAVGADALIKTLSGDTEARTLVRNPRSTVVPSRGDEPSGKHVLEVLRTLHRDPRALVDEGSIGQGGMGVVRLATQVALGRKVAVKYLRPEHRSERDIEALLAEAWRTGSLEHPNIAPVHDLGLDADGLPVLVMKRIEGVTWATLLRDPAAMAAHAPGRAPLEEHLRILTHVCNALHFAHSRGVIHRDVKPDNVMVGAFGEVYLVDWGIATSPGPSTQLAGTPVYMAPEMLGGEGAALTPRTDVYLLGAVLCEIISGRAPHDASSPAAMVESVTRSAPDLPDSAPAELRALALACMNRDPAQRPESALAVRRGLEDFLEHQGSLELGAQSERRLEELLTLLAAPAPDARAFDVFSECRFGFQQALRAWKGNERARAGLDRAVQAMVRHQLKSGSARAAQALLADLSTPDEALAREVAAAVENEGDRAKELERLLQLERSLDPRTGGTLRMTVALVLGTFWVIAPIAGKHLTVRWPAQEMLMSAGVSLVSALVLLVIGAVTQQEKTPLNRQLLRVVVFGMLTQTAFIGGHYFLEGDLGARGVPLMSGYWFLLSGIVALALVPEIWPTALGYLGTTVVAFCWPEYRYEAIAASNGVFCANALVVFWRLRKEELAKHHAELCVLVEAGLRRPARPPQP